MVKLEKWKKKVKRKMPRDKKTGDVYYCPDDIYRKRKTLTPDETHTDECKMKRE